MTAVSLAELIEAYDWLSGGEQFDAEAFVNRATGEVVLVGVAEDEEQPAGLDDDALFAAVPSKRELDLGKSLALQFVRERLPELSPRAERIPPTLALMKALGVPLQHACFRCRKCFKRPQFSGAFSRFMTTAQKAGQHREATASRWAQSGLLHSLVRPHRRSYVASKAIKDKEPHA